MEAYHPTAGDRRNPSLFDPVAIAAAPSGLCDRMTRLTCHRGRPVTPRKPHFRFEPHHGRCKSTPSSIDSNLVNVVFDVLNHLGGTRLPTPHHCPRLGDPPQAPERRIPGSPMAPDDRIRDVVTQLTVLMQSLSMMDEAEAVETDGSLSDAYSDGTASDAENDTEDNFVIEPAEGILTASRFQLPMQIYLKLHTYQREALSWLWSLHCSGVGGLLGDDMGLGKTMQIAAFLAGLFHSCLIKRVLIVCPKTILTRWTEELKYVGLEEKIREYHGANRSVRNSELSYVFKEGGVLLTTYDTVRCNYEAIRGDFYNHSDEEEGEIWNYVVLDEGHMIKDPKSQRAKSLHDIPCLHRIIITGTPLQNSLMEMWALFSFCCPEVLGNVEDFKTRYEKIIVQGTNKNATSEEKQTGSVVAMQLRDQIRPYFLRRMKGEVQFDADPSGQTSLPNKHELVIWLKLTDFQRRMYCAFLNGGQVDLTKQGAVFSAISTLKQICDHPGGLDVSKYPDILSDNSETRNFPEMISELKDLITANTLEDTSCKLSFIMSLLEILIKEERRILIFSETLYMLDCIEGAIKLEGYNFLRIDGKIGMSERHRLVEEFQGGSGAAILLLSAKVGGLGVTLTNASRVILVNPSWNPSTDSQKVDRSYRYGQKNDVIVYRLMTSGTIEEKIYKLQVFKGALFLRATRKGKLELHFSKEEAGEVLSLPKQGFDVCQTQKTLEKKHRHQSIDESLRRHIESLEQQGIAGVSQHSFLFNESTILPPMG